MKTQLELMNALQRWALTGRRPADFVDTIDAVRAQIPGPVLAHFDRLLARGRKGVADVVNGVCTGCHLRLPAATAARGAAHDDLEICEHCGAYLQFPPVENTPPPVLAHPRRRYRATAVA